MRLCVCVNTIYSPSLLWKFSLSSSKMPNERSVDNSLGSDQIAMNFTEFEGAPSGRFKENSKCATRERSVSVTRYTLPIRK